MLLPRRSSTGDRCKETSGSRARLQSGALPLGGPSTVRGGGSQQLDSKGIVLRVLHVNRNNIEHQRTRSPSSAVLFAGG